MRRVAVVAAALGGVLVAGVVAARVGHDSRDQTTDRDLASIGAPAPTASSAGSAARASESAPDVGAARRAAVMAVAATGAVATAGFISRRDLIGSFTTQRLGPALAAETSAQLRSLAVELGDRDAEVATMSVAEIPVTATTSVSGAAVVVDVWSVLVVAVPNVSPARQVWRTVTLDMVEVGGRWLVDGWSSRAGPTPALTPSTALDPVDDVTARLMWPVALGAGG